MANGFYNNERNPLKLSELTNNGMKFLNQYREGNIGQPNEFQSRNIPNFWSKLRENTDF